MPIAKDVQLGRDVRIFHPDLVNLYGCSIGDESRIGTFVEIQAGATIGARCKISSHSFICEGVSIEDEVFIGHGVMFTNDKYPRATAADGRPPGPCRLDGGTDPCRQGSVDRVERNHPVRNHHWCRSHCRCRRGGDEGRSLRRGRRGGAGARHTDVRGRPSPASRGATA